MIKARCLYGGGHFFVCKYPGCGAQLRQERKNADWYDFP